jgi:hypothetical protein
LPPALPCKRVRCRHRPRRMSRHPGCGRIISLRSIARRWRVRQPSASASPSAEVTVAPAN